LEKVFIVSICTRSYKKENLYSLNIDEFPQLVCKLGMPSVSGWSKPWLNMLIIDLLHWI